MYWMTRLSHQWIFFLSWWLRHIPGTTMPKLCFCCETVENEDTWVLGSMRSNFHELATTESRFCPIKGLWDVLEKTEGMVRLSCHQYKISAKNECSSEWKYILRHCIRLSKQLANAHHNQSKRRSNKILECFHFQQRCMGVQYILGYESFKRLVWACGYRYARGRVAMVTQYIV